MQAGSGWHGRIAAAACKPLCLGTAQQQLSHFLPCDDVPTVIPADAEIQCCYHFLDPGACPGPRSGVRRNRGQGIVESPIFA
jgi:hypothetical protein